jgi:hypothetical protein
MLPSADLWSHQEVSIKVALAFRNIGYIYWLSGGSSVCRSGSEDPHCLKGLLQTIPIPSTTHPPTTQKSKDCSLCQVLSQSQTILGLLRCNLRFLVKMQSQIFGKEQLATAQVSALGVSLELLPVGGVGLAEDTALLASMHFCIFFI